MLGGALFTYDAAGEPTWVAGFQRGSTTVEYLAYNGACPWCTYRRSPTVRSAGRSGCAADRASDRDHRHAGRGVRVRRQSRRRDLALRRARRRRIVAAHATAVLHDRRASDRPCARSDERPRLGVHRRLPPQQRRRVELPLQRLLAGSIEIAGFSDCLHPLASGLVLGFGKDAKPADGTGTFAMPVRIHDGPYPQSGSGDSAYYPWLFSGLARFELRGTSAADAHLVILPALVTHVASSSTTYGIDPVTSTARSVLFRSGSLRRQRPVLAPGRHGRRVRALLTGTFVRRCRDRCVCQNAFPRRLSLSKGSRTLVRLHVRALKSESGLALRGSA